MAAHDRSDDVSGPTDARARAQKRYEVQKPRGGRLTGQTPSLDGRVPGRPRNLAAHQ
jgi:hypothetical protein